MSDLDANAIMAQQQQIAEAQQQQKYEEEARQVLLSRAMTPEALERLKRVKLVKREVVEQVERLIEQNARSGRLKAVIQENDIVELLNKYTAMASENRSVSFQRKKQFDEVDKNGDSDDDLR